MFLWKYSLFLVIPMCLSAITHGDDLTKTRPEMKKQIQVLKGGVSRLALPPPTAEEMASGRPLYPHAILDPDIERLREHFSDFELAEIIQLIGNANAFDRFTEALHLPMESLVR